MGKIVKGLFGVLVAAIVLPLVGIVLAAVFLTVLGGAGLVLLFALAVVVLVLICLPLIILAVVWALSRRTYDDVTVTIHDDQGRARYRIHLPVVIEDWLHRIWQQYRANKRAGRGDALNTAVETVLMNELKPQVAAAVAAQYSAADGERVTQVTDMRQFDLDINDSRRHVHAGRNVDSQS